MAEKEILWYENDIDELAEDENVIGEYDLTSSPNDFNIMTINDFLNKGVVKIPGFQRNYVWDIKMASKLIESIIIGLPIPQIFLYEKSRNDFLVIDGQQRLMSIYYFIKERFPRKEARAELKEIFTSESVIPEEILNDDRLFTDFKLQLPERLPNKHNKLNKLTYSALGDFKTTFELRTIRNIIIKSNLPDETESQAVFEIFNRLNTGGVKLNSQEIRLSLFSSTFYEMLYRINADKSWRNLTGQESPDLHMKDIEFLLRGFAMLLQGESYQPSMVKFLNSFSKKAKAYPTETVEYLEKLFLSFVNNCKEMDQGIFINKSGKFIVSLFEVVFATVCKEYVDKKELIGTTIGQQFIETLKHHPDFIRATQSQTTSKEHVQLRLDLGRGLYS